MKAPYFLLNDEAKVIVLRTAVGGKLSLRRARTFFGYLREIHCPLSKRRLLAFISVKRAKVQETLEKLETMKRNVLPDGSEAEHIAQFKREYEHELKAHSAIYDAIESAAPNWNSVVAMPNKFRNSAGVPHLFKTGKNKHDLLLKDLKSGVPKTFLHRDFLMDIARRSKGAYTKTILLRILEDGRNGTERKIWYLNGLGKLGTDQKRLLDDLCFEKKRFESAKEQVKINLKNRKPFSLVRFGSPKTKGVKK
ncbi:hypothetical protein COU36_01760 [Candidatus Micrarchaeota archaeon CG10_big_fil_rev_8_21_14_0_10_59_7]|nr:MAG: hypothetical protein COU36_01760 [Candidatus Micrarchaeota archaeon CG10_big_fil_rev_8_21_14_0_10_59_7]